MFITHLFLDFIYFELLSYCYWYHFFLLLVMRDNVKWIDIDWAMESPFKTYENIVLKRTTTLKISTFN